MWCQYHVCTSIQDIIFTTMHAFRYHALLYVCPFKIIEDYSHGSDSDFVVYNFVTIKYWG